MTIHVDRDRERGRPTGNARRLTSLVEHRARLWQAQGVLMEKHGYTSEAALARMYVCAHKLGIDVALVAAAVIERFSVTEDGTS